MFSKNDLFSYFDQIQRIEERMQESYIYLHDHVTHPEYKKIFSQLIQEEIGHSNMIERLKDLCLK